MSTLTITAADLNRGHLGMTVSFAIGESAFTDMLRSVTHKADLIEEDAWFDEVPRYVLGRSLTVVGLLHAGEVALTVATLVKVTQ
jgi:hypothetical protein